MSATIILYSAYPMATSTRKDNLKLKNFDYVLWFDLIWVLSIIEGCGQNK